jgi:hypothetical protein
MSNPNPPIAVSKSGAVTALAVVTFLMGGLRLALSVAALVLAGQLFSAAGGVTGPPDPSPNADPISGMLIPLIQLMSAGLLLAILVGAGIVLVILGLVFLPFSVLLFFAGWGLLGRRSWARWVTLVLGGLGGLLALLYLAQWVLGYTNSAEGLIVSLIGILVHGSYAALVFAVLLNKRNAAEFA